jgi:hypothetical protein
MKLNAYTFSIALKCHAKISHKGLWLMMRESPSFGPVVFLAEAMSHTAPGKSLRVDHRSCLSARLTAQSLRRYEA